MKYLYTLLFFVSFYQAYAQKYQPLVEEGKYWIYELSGTGDNPCDYRWTNSAEMLHFGIDTLINDTIYVKVLVSRLRQSGPMDSPVYPYEITSTYVIRFIREDTLTKKIFLLPNDNFYNPCKEELRANLLFNFSLEEGDTLNECLRNSIERFGNPDEPFYPKVDSVKYEIDFYGKTRKHIYSFGYFEQCNFLHSPGFVMEGFGFSDGPFRGLINRKLINYCEGTLSDCNIISSTSDAVYNKINKIIISPNPTVEFITIETALDINVVEIINQNGMSVLKGNDKQINVSNLITGVYFVRCSTLQKEMYYNKFIKI